jgi:hypothetical protein
MLSRWKLAFACGAATFGAALPALAQAVPDCTTVPEYANSLIGGGGSAVSPTLSEVARAIANSSAPDEEKFTIFYWAPSACTGYRAFKDGVSPATAQSFTYYVKGATVAEAEKKCNGTSLPLAFSHMGSEIEFCAGETKPADIGDFPAPIQSVNVIAHKNSTEDKISAEALHFIYGYGQNGQVTPWTASNGVIQRDDTSFVHNFLADFIQVPRTAFWWDKTANYVPADHGGDPDPKAQFAANHVTSNGATFTAIAKYVADGGLADNTLGYISGSNADKSRDQVKTLAFQAIGQRWAVYPDKNENAFDKINVRKGNYALWAPGHFYGKIDNKKKLVDPSVAKLIGWFERTEVPPGNVDVTRSIIAAGDIPECAMEAYRDTATGPIYSYAPSKPCGCYFETIATGAQPAACVACSADAECPGDGEKCNYGYCEAYRAAGESEG